MLSPHRRAHLDVTVETNPRRRLQLPLEQEATTIDAPQQQTNPARSATEGETKKRKDEMKGGRRLRHADANVRR